MPKTTKVIAQSESPILDAAMNRHMRTKASDKVSTPKEGAMKFSKDYSPKINGHNMPIAFDPNGVVVRIGEHQEDISRWININQTMDAKGVLNGYIALTLTHPYAVAEVGLYLHHTIESLEKRKYVKNVGHVASYYNGKYVHLFKNVLSRLEPGELAVVDYKFGSFMLRRVCENLPPEKGEAEWITWDRRAIFKCGGMDLLQEGMSLTIQPNLFPAKDKGGNVTQTGVECTKSYLQKIADTLTLTRDEAQEQWDHMVIGKKVRKTIAKANSEFYAENDTPEKVEESTKNFNKELKGDTVTFVTGEVKPLSDFVGKTLALFDGTEELGTRIYVTSVPAVCKAMLKSINANHLTVALVPNKI
jgi:hypothetical protein